MGRFPANLEELLGRTLPIESFVVTITDKLCVSLCCEMVTVLTLVNDARLRLDAFPLISDVS